MVTQNAFGSTQCANDLATILNDINDKHLSRKVAAHIHRKFHFIKQLAESNLDSSAKKHIARLYRMEVKDYLYNTVKLTNQHCFPDYIRDRIFNLFTRKLRIHFFDGHIFVSRPQVQVTEDSTTLAEPIILTKSILSEIKERHNTIDQLNSEKSRT